MISTIIPAHNEEKTISQVIGLCLQVPEIKEIIVVNDGSTDRTVEEVKKITDSRVKLINLKKNRGKGYAVAQGVKATQNPIILLLDADLINLEPHHLLALIQPVIDDRVDMTIADLKTSFTRPSSLIWPFSGQRCLKKELILPFLKEIASSGYGLEVVLNERLKKKRIIVVPLISDKKEFYLKKPKKQKDWLSAYIRQTWQIFQNLIKLKSERYQKQAKKKFLNQLARYLKINLKRIRFYLDNQ